MTAPQFQQVLPVSRSWSSQNHPQEHEEQTVYVRLSARFDQGTMCDVAKLADSSKVPTGVG